MDLADPSHLEFDYLRWIRIVLRAAWARRVLHIGGGACALPRALVAADPSGRHEVCEIDAEVLAVAREHLGLRRMPGLRVRHAEGRDFLARCRDASWDAVVIDAFAGAAIPPHLVTAEALSDSARVAPMTLINVVDARSARHQDAVAAALAPGYRHVWALGGRGSNTVVVGTAATLDLDRIRAQSAADPSPARVITPAQMARRIVGAAPARDAKPAQV